MKMLTKKYHRTMLVTLFLLVLLQGVGVDAACDPVLMGTTGTILAFSRKNVTATTAKPTCEALMKKSQLVNMNDAKLNKTAIAIVLARQFRQGALVRVLPIGKAIRVGTSFNLEDIDNKTRAYCGCQVNFYISLHPNQCSLSIAAKLPEPLVLLEQSLNFSMQLIQEKPFTTGRQPSKFTNNQAQLTGMTQETTYKFKARAQFTGCGSFQVDSRSSLTRFGKGNPVPVQNATVFVPNLCVVHVPAQTLFATNIETYQIESSNGNQTKVHDFPVNATIPQILRVNIDSYKVNQTVSLTIIPTPDNCKISKMKINGSCQPPACKTTIFSVNDTMYVASNDQANSSTAATRCTMLGGSLAVITNNETIAQFREKLLKKYWRGDEIYVAGDQGEIKKIIFGVTNETTFMPSISLLSCGVINCTDQRAYYLCQARFKVSAHLQPCNSSVIKVRWSSNLLKLARRANYDLRVQFDVNNSVEATRARSIEHPYKNLTWTLTNLRPITRYFITVTVLFKGCTSLSINSVFNVTTGYGRPDPVKSAKVTQELNGCFLNFSKTAGLPNVSYYVTASSNYANSTHSYNISDNNAQPVRFRVILKKHASVENVTFKIQAENCEGRSAIRGVEGSCIPLSTKESAGDMSISVAVLAGGGCVAVVLVIVAIVAVVKQRRRTKSKNATMSSAHYTASNENETFSGEGKVSLTVVGDTRDEDFNRTAMEPRTQQDVTCDREMVDNALYACGGNVRTTAVVHGEMVDNDLYGATRDEVNRDERNVDNLLFGSNAWQDVTSPGAEMVDNLIYQATGEIVANAGGTTGGETVDNVLYLSTGQVTANDQKAT